jgi:hypothetical protein
MLDGPDRLGELGRLSKRIDDAQNEAKSVPVEIRVTGDSDSRIEAAFAKAFTDQGFRTGASNSRYVLEFALKLERETGERDFSTTCIVDAILKDTRNGTNLFSYNLRHREGHPSSQATADSRALQRTAERVGNEFPGVLQNNME